MTRAVRTGDWQRALRRGLLAGLAFFLLWSAVVLTAGFRSPAQSWLSLFPASIPYGLGLGAFACAATVLAQRGRERLARALWVLAVVGIVGIPLLTFYNVHFIASRVEASGADCDSYVGAFLRFLEEFEKHATGADREMLQDAARELSRIRGAGASMLCKELRRNPALRPALDCLVRAKVYEEFLACDLDTIRNSMAPAPQSQ